jgi:hypothetical protein
MIKTIKENIIFKNNFWEVKNNDVIFNNSVKGQHIKMKSGQSIGGVAVLPIDSEGYIHIQEEFRYGLEDYITHIAMGGQLESETKEEAVLKELEEEMGLSTDSLIYFDYFQEMVNVMNHKLHLFVATNVFEQSKRKKEETESFRNKRRIKLEDAYKMALNNEFKCAATQLLIIKYYLSIQK